MSFEYQDLLDKERVEGNSKLGKKLGWKTGRGRAEFSATGGLPTGAYPTTLILPVGCTVTRVLYKVLTAFTSADSTATIALSLVGANDIVSAAAINAGGTPWAATTIPVATLVLIGTLSSALTTTAVQSTLTATVAVEALTAGKLVVFLEWFYWGDLPTT